MDAPLAVSLGDPAGVGPELIAQAWANRDADQLPAFFVVGGASVLEAAADMRGIECPIARIDKPSDAAKAFASGLPVLGTDDASYIPGIPDEAGAALSLGSLAEATRLALLEEAGGVVTAPVAKSQLAKVGFEYPGQTEFLAAACGLPTDNGVMMLAGPSLRAVPITVHCSLAEVPKQLTTGLIYSKGRIVADALRRDFGIARPRLAICGLNPHAGEDGKFGTEERDIIEPAIELLGKADIAASGPHAADALFAAHKRGSYDAAICMYHDQALIPVKALDFDQGVNVTLGLPIVRTSPDHGTAFDIAGNGIADPGAMIAALQMAARCAAYRHSSNG